MRNKPFDEAQAAISKIRLESRADTGFHSGCCEILKRENILKKRKFSIDRAKAKYSAYFRVKNYLFNIRCSGCCG